MDYEIFYKLNLTKTFYEFNFNIIINFIVLWLNRYSINNQELFDCFSSAIMTLKKYKHCKFTNFELYKNILDDNGVIRRRKV